MNLSGLLSIFEQLPAYEKALASLDDTGISPLHLPATVRAITMAKLFSDSTKPMLFVTGRPDAVGVWQAALETWMPPGAEVLRFREPTPLPFERAPWSDECRMERLRVLTRLMAGKHRFLPENRNPLLIITSARALLQKTIPQRRLLSNLKVIKLNQILDLKGTLESWEANGYSREAVVEAPCQFSNRGGIIDIFPASSPYPVRIELFGDEVDTMRYFDPATQRSIADKVTQIIIPPAREALPGLAPQVGEMLAVDAPPKEDDLPDWQDDIDTLLAGESSEFIEYYLPLMYRKAASLLDYLPADTNIVVDDWAALNESVRDLEGRAASVANQMMTLPGYFPSPLHNWDDMAADLAERGVTVLGEREENPASPADDAPIELADLIQPGPRYGGQERPFLTQLQRAHEMEQRIVVVSRQSARLADLWRDFNKARGGGSNLFETRIRVQDSIVQMPEENSLRFVQGSLAEGFVIEDMQGTPILHVLSDAEVYGWNRPAPRRRKVQRAVAPETYYSDLQPGDFVVHIEYGIGQFQQLVMRSIGGNDREYLQIEYANGDVLYIPVHHADRLSKWLGADGGKPNLHRVGEKRWGLARKRAQKAVDELADELLELYAEREAIPGHAFAEDNDWQAEMEASFPYQETEDQLVAIDDVKRDMEKTTPMDRLICGDVGFGKTEVALRAAFKAVMDGKQVAILVPTTVLAQQHYKTFSERVHPYPVQVALLSRFQTGKENETSIRKMRDGEIDIAIGTHRLLSQDVGFKDLGLVIIDEEQRFGVGHKERLKQLRTEVDVLTMTATPIPRTMYMGLSGIRDISNINTPPNERLPIVTYVGQSDNDLVKRAFMRELDRGGQIYFVHNHVQTIEAARRFVETLVPDARIGVGHGQMGESQLEVVMKQFADYEIDILVCTTIIESGLDIPNANTLIVDRAENFGLSQLYQLRGRVGRGVRRAYAYFFHTSWRALSEDARARLETLDEHTELGAGYSIAMRDLEIRGAGDILGGTQSGHIATVGFDLYTRMLTRAVRARKAKKNGEEFSAEIPAAVTIDLPLPAYLPTDYIPDAPLRLRLYRRMAGLEDLEGIGEFSAEMTDRFGPIPDPLGNLLYQLRVKLLAGRAGVTTIYTESNQVRIKMDNEHIDRQSLQHFLGSGVRVSKTALWLDPNLSTSDLKVRLVQILERVGEWKIEAARRAARFHQSTQSQ